MNVKSQMQIYHIHNNRLEFYFGNYDFTKNESLKEMFNNFMQMDYMKNSTIRIGKYKIILSNITVSKHILKKYWSCSCYNITLPYISTENLHENLFKNHNILQLLQKYYIRVYNDNKLNVIKIYINIFNMDKNDLYKNRRLLLDELHKLNKYITCDNKNCTNKCNNTDVVKCTYGNLYNNYMINIKNTTFEKKINEIPLCKICEDNLLEQQCYICLTMFTKNDKIINKCGNVTHSIHYSCKTEEQNKILQNISCDTNINVLLVCGICKQQNNKYLNIDDFKNHYNIPEEDNIDSEYDYDYDYDDDDDDYDDDESEDDVGNEDILRLCDDEIIDHIYMELIYGT
jgi:hypothetical protein